MQEPWEQVSRDEVIDAIQTLVRVPSVNPLIAPDEGRGEAAVARAACAWLAARGVEAWLEEAAADRPNAVAQIGDAAAPTLVFCAHLDTVGTSEMTIPPFEPRISEGRLYGRGSYDMKGSAGAVMAAAAALSRQRLPARILLALVADEEAESVGAFDFVRRHAADACIVTEPSEGRLILGHKGFVWVEIVTRGRAAHGSRWDLGISANARLARIVAALDEFDRRELRQRMHPLVGPASMHPAVVTGGSGWSTYAAESRVRVERRTIPGETTEEILGELGGVVRDIGEEAEIRLVCDRPPLVCDAKAPIAESVRNAARLVTGATPAETGVAYWMDAAVFAQAGIPAVNYGPGGAGAHEPVEWLDLESAITTARVLVAAAWNFAEPRSRTAERRT